MKSVLTRSLVAFFLAAFAMTASAETSNEYRQYISGLNAVYSELQESAGLFDQGAIYTEKHIDRVWYLPENTELKSAGLRLLSYLYDNERLYEGLEFSEWLALSEHLLLMDEWIGKRIAWGNFVIKAKICSDIVSRTADMLLADQENMSEEQLTLLLDFWLKFRPHIPSDQAMAYLALRHYELDTEEVMAELKQPVKLDYLESAADFSGPGEEMSLRKLNRKSRLIDGIDRGAISSLATEEMKRGRDAKKIIDLYALPLPMGVAALARYREVTWDISFHLLLLGHNDIDQNTEWPSLDENVVFKTLDRAFTTPQGFWSGKQFSGMKLKRYPRQHLRRIRESGGLKMIARFRAEQESDDPLPFFIIHALR